MKMNHRISPENGLNKKLALKLLLFVALSSGIGACTDEMMEDFEDEADLLNKPAEIINGTELSITAARNSGVVFLEPVGCSGTLLNSRWILTANHCFGDYLDANGNLIDIDANNDGIVDNPGRITVRFGHNTDTDAELRTPAAIYSHPNGTFGSAGGTDAALIYLSSDAPSVSLPAGHFTNNRMLIYNGGDEQLVGTVLKSMGYGKNVTGCGAPWTGVGILREGTVRASTYLSSTTIGTVSDSAPDGLIANGDSGGPLFLDIQGDGGMIARYVLGIASTADCATVGYYVRADAFGAWVESMVFGTAPATITCQTWGCSSSPNPLPNNAFAYRAFAPFGAITEECYYAGVSIGFEQNYDFFNMGNEHLSGNITAGTHWCGTLPLSLTTDYSIQSNGLYQLWHNNHSSNAAPPSSECAGVIDGWEGCRGTGCHACIELLTDYPRYFVNHPNCVPNMTCENEHYTCSANCPAPTSADQ